MCAKLFDFCGTLAHLVRKRLVGPCPLPTLHVRGVRTDRRHIGFERKAWPVVKAQFAVGQVNLEALEVAHPALRQRSLFLVQPLQAAINERSELCVVHRPQGLSRLAPLEEPRS